MVSVDTVGLKRLMLTLILKAILIYQYANTLI